MTGGAPITLKDGILLCVCGAKCKAGGKEAKRFTTRHPRLCQERKQFTQQLAQGVKSVEPVEWRGDESAKPRDWKG